MLGLHFAQLLLFRETCLIQRLTHPARCIGKRAIDFWSSHHDPNGLAQITAGAARVSILTGEGEVQRIGPKQPSRHIIQFTLPQYGKEPIGIKYFLLHS